MIQRFKLSIATMLLLLSVGCTGGDAVQSIDTDGADFSSAEDYQAYDLEMATLSEGQQE